MGWFLVYILPQIKHHIFFQRIKSEVRSETNQPLPPMACSWSIFVLELKRLQNHFWNEGKLWRFYQCSQSTFIFRTFVVTLLTLFFMFVMTSQSCHEIILKSDVHNNKHFNVCLVSCKLTNWTEDGKFLSFCSFYMIYWKFTIKCIRSFYWSTSGNWSSWWFILPCKCTKSDLWIWKQTKM